MIASIKQKYPKFKVVDKNKSKLMRFIAWFLRTTHINRDFMSYATAIHYTLYIPGGYISPGPLLDHELMHVEQYHRYGLIYDIAYLLWPVLMVFSFFSFLAFVNIWHLLWLLFLLAWVPIPWTFRGLIEAEAYAAGLVNRLDDRGMEWAEEKIKYYAKDVFASSQYYYMMSESLAIKYMKRYLEKLHARL